ncbi:DNA polymerase III subunit delta' [Rhodanobacter aciditrophus]|uniref:DNA-directed DNA polymerase n=1 Tax=Rhodanobacter aciditrophus TaxID=1623218 RepID=A0ABW4B345_9GAMM
MRFPDWLLDPYQQAVAWRKSGNFHHALMMTGANGIGQGVFAEQIARLLLCEHPQSAPCGKCHSCELVKSETHPDWLTLDGSAGSIKVDAVRQVVAKVANKPQLGYSKVVLIQDAHAMNINAANAILKALEEPPAATYFLLTSNTSRSLMPTIISRCQRLNLPSPNPEQTAHWLEGEGKSNAAELLWFSQAPFRLLSLAESSSHEMMLTLPDELEKWLSGQSRSDELVSAVNNDKIHYFIDGVLAVLHGALMYSAAGQCHERIKPAIERILMRYDLYRLMEMIKRLETLKSNLDKTHLNPTIQLIGELNSW